MKKTILRYFVWCALVNDRVSPCYELIIGELTRHTNGTIIDALEAKNIIEHEGLKLVHQTPHGEIWQ